MGAEIIAGAIVGAASLAAAGVSAYSASETNASSQNFAAAQNDEARSFAERMYNKQFAEGNAEYDRRQAKANANSKELTEWMYKNFNSPSAQVAALRKAGINPAVSFASGGSGFSQQLMQSALPSVSPPAGISAPAQSPVGLQAPGNSFHGAIGEIASAFAQIQSGNKSAAETKTIDATRDAIITDLVLKNSGQEIANQFSAFHLNLDKAFSERKIKDEIRKLEADAVTSYYSGKHQEALSKLVDIQSTLAKYQDKCNQAMLPYLEENCKQIALSYQFENRVKKAQESAQRAMASASYAQAGLADAQTQTENELRSSKVNISKAQAREALNKVGISQHDFIRSVESMKHSENINKWRQQNPKAARVLDAVGYTVESLSGPLIGGILKVFK